MKVRVLPVAEEELADAARRYEGQRHGLGHDLLAAFVDAMFELEKHPRRFPKDPAATADREIRRYRLRRFPYFLGYEVLKDEAVVLAFSHTARQPRYWQHRTP